MKRWFLICLLFLGLPVQAVTLEFWVTITTERAKILTELVEEHFTPQTGISIECFPLSYDDLWTKSMLALAAGDTPDLATFGSEWPVEFGIRGGLVDLRATYGEEFEAMERLLYPGLMRSLEFKGTAFGLPVEFGYGLTFYRTDIFEENGWEYPATWNETRELLPKMQAKEMNLACISQYLTPEWSSVLGFIWQKGGVYVNDDGLSSGLGTTMARDGFVEFTELFTKYKIPQAPVPFNTFADGTYPMVVGGNWNYAGIQYGFPQIAGRWGIGLYPGTQRDGAINHAIYNGPLPIGIFRNSPNKDEAWAFMKWFFSREIQTEYGRRVQAALPGNYFFSANREAIGSIASLPPDHVQIMVEQSMHSLAPRYGMGSVISKRYVTNAIVSVILTGSNPEQAIAGAHQQMEAEMKSKTVEYQRFISRLK